MHNGHNDSIGCNVGECKYHAQGENYCTLEHIQVTKHGGSADSVECTDCASFQK
ncbi:MAG: DUF1540 domain-containing protein [Clostridiaceae bacterium]